MEQTTTPERVSATASAARRPRPAPLTVTEGASNRIAAILSAAPADAVGVRLSTPRRGCSGLAYDLAYVTAAKPGDERIDTAGGTLFVDGGSLMYLIGSIMDWREDDFTAGFVFNNPNAKGSCGCGESFTV
ncbi:iron-sulfur cluster assembly accessory protein [Sandarakinorhabdus sp.]|uniref:HesB/IscA family protein n=1 Tax=Sandarakinorhabdus sp. TaxID=1916663 RepID=UPI00286E01C4|nr:iron-sulfur cluster assembly accessory protein [Sandarakinorhabdus sp.]